MHITILIMFAILSLFKTQASEIGPLNSFLYNYAFTTMHRHRTGFLYEVTPPVNLTGVKVSIIRLRAHRLWRNGANFNEVEIPAVVLPSPFTKRVDIVYQNLGNWSDFYYSVPNYTFVTPVIGFLVYDSTMNRKLVELNTRPDNPMVVRFQNVSEDGRMKCVWFGVNGTWEFSNVGARSSCETTRVGHFSIVVPRENRGKTGGNRGKTGENRVFKWWIVGIVGGILGFIVVLVIGGVGFVFFDWKRVGKMVKESERSEVLDTIWVGNSRMPSASGIRTQPILETSYVP